MFRCRDIKGKRMSIQNNEGYGFCHIWEAQFSSCGVYQNAGSRLDIG